MGTFLSVCIPKTIKRNWRRKYKEARFLLGQLRSLERTYSALMKRLEQPPGIPVSHPTPSFWLDNPSPIADYSIPDGKFPTYADVVIIGSGITGMSVARTLVGAGRGLKVVMLEARAACSGATGR